MELHLHLDLECHPTYHLEQTHQNTCHLRWFSLIFQSINSYQSEHRRIEIRHRHQRAPSRQLPQRHLLHHSLHHLTDRHLCHLVCLEACLIQHARLWMRSQHHVHHHRIYTDRRRFHHCKASLKIGLNGIRMLHRPHGHFAGSDWQGAISDA